METQQTHPQPVVTTPNEHAQRQETVQHKTNLTPITPIVHHTTTENPYAVPPTHAPNGVSPVQSISNQLQQLASTQQSPPNMTVANTPYNMYNPQHTVQQATISHTPMNSIPLPQYSQGPPAQPYNQHHHQIKQSMPVMSPSMAPVGVMTSSFNTLPNNTTEQTMPPIIAHSQNVQHNMVHPQISNVQPTHTQPPFQTSNVNGVNNNDYALTNTAHVLSSATNVLYNEQYCSDFPNLQ